MIPDPELTWANNNLYFPSLDEYKKRPHVSQNPDLVQQEWFASVHSQETWLIPQMKTRQFERPSFEMPLGQFMRFANVAAGLNPTGRPLSLTFKTNEWFQPFFQSYVRVWNELKGRAEEALERMTQSRKRAAEEEKAECSEWDAGHARCTETKKQKTEREASEEKERGGFSSNNGEYYPPLAKSDVMREYCMGTGGTGRCWWDFKDAEILKLPPTVLLQRYRTAVQYLWVNSWPPRLLQLTYEVEIKGKEAEWYKKLSTCPKWSDQERKGILFMTKRLAPNPADNTVESKTYYSVDLTQALAEYRWAARFTSTEIQENSVIQGLKTVLGNASSGAWGYTPLGFIVDGMLSVIDGKFITCELNPWKTDFNCSFKADEKAHILSIRSSILQLLDITNTFSTPDVVQCEAKNGWDLLPDWVLWVGLGVLGLVTLGATASIVHDVREIRQ
jgi:hypothetical protein